MNSASVTLTYKATTGQEYLNPDLKGQLDFAEYCNHTGEADGPTHIVSGITRGFYGIFNFRKRTNDSNENNKVGRMLSDTITDNPFTIGGLAALNLTQEEWHFLHDVKCSFHGDAILDPPPTTFIEVVVAYKKIPALAKNSKAIIR